MAKGKMKIKIFNSTQNLEKVCAAAAKMSSTEGTCTDVYKGFIDLEDIRRTLSRILRLGHVSVSEHGYFNIKFQNVSLFFEQFLIEHRIAAYTIKSGRYVNFSKAGCYEPEFRYKNDVPESLKDEVKKEYMKFVAKSFKLYERFVAEDVKVEDARFVLPYSLKTNIFCSMDARELLHLIWAMLYGRGKDYPELVVIGTQLKKQLAKRAPSIEENLQKIENGEEIKEEMLNELLGKPIFKTEEDTAVKPLIDLLNISSNPKETIAISAIVKNKQCTLQEAELMLKDDVTLADKILDIVFKDGRRRELEQVNITFRINDIPLILLKHQTRHRIQSINIPSFTEMAATTRYTYPPSILEKGKEFEILLKNAYEEASNLYKKFEDLGVYNEDLAYLFLHAKNVDIVTTMNARTLYHICGLRTCNRAQWKMSYYYNELLNQLMSINPDIFGRFGPNCYIKGYCPEGKKTCGDMVEIKKKFSLRGLKK